MTSIWLPRDYENTDATNGYPNMEGESLQGLNPRGNWGMPRGGEMSFLGKNTPISYPISSVQPWDHMDIGYTTYTEQTGFIDLEIYINK